MSKIEELIKEKCPNGVIYKKIIDLAEIGTGSSNRKDAIEDGLYPFYVRSKEIFKINKYEYDEEAIIIPGEGGIGEIFHYVNGKYALHQRAYRIHLVDSSLSTKFLYYYMFNFFKKFIMKKAVSATVTSIRKPMIEQFCVPIPPIEVQEEIVRILDQFGKLEAELEAELEARKSQYNYYRKLLLDKEENLISIGNLFEFKNGINKSKDCFGKGNKIINYVDVYKNNKITDNIVNGLVELNDSDLNRYSCRKGDVFFTRTSETREEVGIASVLIDDMNESVFSGFLLRARPITDLLIPEYCAYCFSSPRVRRDIISFANFTTRATVTGPILSKVKIYVPSKEEQKRIVKILDKMYTLVNSFIEGIPAEIEARRKQYEYYRNKLLSFEEVSCE